MRIVHGLPANSLVLGVIPDCSRATGPGVYCDSWRKARRRASSSSASAPPAGSVVDKEAPLHSSSKQIPLHASTSGDIPLHVFVVAGHGSGSAGARLALRLLVEGMQRRRQAFAVGARLCEQVQKMLECRIVHASATSRVPRSTRRHMRTQLTAFLICSSWFSLSRFSTAAGRSAAFGSSIWFEGDLRRSREPRRRETRNPIAPLRPLYSRQ